MCRLALLGAAAAAVVGFGSCPGAARLAHAAAPSRTATAAGEPFLGVLRASAHSPMILTRFDPLSLRPVSAQVLHVGEYHRAWSLSPDGSQLALGVSSGESILSPSRRLHRRIGIYIVDLGALKVVQEVQTGIVAEALAWLAPRLLVAALQRGGTVLVDPLTGKVLRRWPGFSFLDAAVRAPNGLVTLFGGSPEIRYVGSAGAWEGTVTPHLGLADARGRFRSMPLERIRLGVRSSGASDQPGLAVDPSRARAHVFTADAPTATVDLRTMRVSYHRLAPSPTRGRSKKVLARDRRALWLGDGHVAVFGHDLLRPAGGERFPSIPAGVTVVDTSTWKTRLLDPTADSAVFAAGMLLAYRSRSSARDGLRMYTVRGRRVPSLLAGEHVDDVRVAGGWAYVRTPRAVYVLDLTLKRIVNKIEPPVELVDVINAS